MLTSCMYIYIYMYTYIGIYSTVIVRGVINMDMITIMMIMIVMTDSSRCAYHGYRSPFKTWAYIKFWPDSDLPVFDSSSCPE